MIPTIDESLNVGTPGHFSIVLCNVAIFKFENISREHSNFLKIKKKYIWKVKNGINKNLVKSWNADT